MNMKTLPVVIAAMLPFITASAQEGVIITSAPTLEPTLNSMDVTLSRLLEKADEQVISLDKLVKSIGDPSLVTAAATATIKQDIMNNLDALNNRESIDTRMRSTTGAEAFGDKSYGLLDPVNATYTTKTGTVEDRDPEKYQLEAALSKLLESYEAESTANDERKKTLLAEYAETLEDMNAAENISTVMKNKALLDVIDGKIRECTDASIKAKQDYDVAKEKLTLASRIAGKAKAENRAFENEADRATAATLMERARASAAAAPATGGGVGWGPRPAATTPPATGSTTSP
jgi:hypothetical protein